MFLFALENFFKYNLEIFLIDILYENIVNKNIFYRTTLL